LIKLNYFLDELELKKLFLPRDFQEQFPANPAKVKQVANKRKRKIAPDHKLKSIFLPDLAMGNTTHKTKKTRLVRSITESTIFSPDGSFDKHSLASLMNF